MPSNAMSAQTWGFAKSDKILFIFHNNYQQSSSQPGMYSYCRSGFVLPVNIILPKKL